jgi:hypothetical protein
MRGAKSVRTTIAAVMIFSTLFSLSACHGGASQGAPPARAPTSESEAQRPVGLWFGTSEARGQPGVWLVQLSDAGESSVFEPPGKRLICDMDATRLIWSTGTDAEDQAYRYESQLHGDSLVGTMYRVRNGAPAGAYPLTLHRVTEPGSDPWSGFYSNFVLHANHMNYLGADLVLFQVQDRLAGILVRYDGWALTMLPIVDVLTARDSIRFSVRSRVSPKTGARFAGMRTSDGIELLLQDQPERLKYQGPPATVFQRSLLACFQTR